MAHWTFELEAAWFDVQSNRKDWRPPDNSRPVVPEALRDSAANERTVSVVNMRSDAARLILNTAAGQTGQSGGADLSSAFETGGQILFFAPLSGGGTAEWLFRVEDANSADTADTYIWNFAGDAATTYNEFRDALSDTAGAQSCTVTMWDGEGVNPFAPALAPAFAGTAVGTFVAAITRTIDTAEVSIAPAFAGAVAGTLAASVVRTAAPAPDTLPYEIDLTGSGSATFVEGFGTFGTGTWSNDALPADRWAGDAPTTIVLGVRGGGTIGDAANGDMRIDIAGVTVGDFTDELEEARLKIQSVDGGTVWWEGILGRIDSTEPYVWSVTDAEALAILSSGVTTVRLRFEKPTTEIAPAFVGTAAGTLAAALAHTEVAEQIEIAPAFAGAMAGTLAVDLRHSRTEIEAAFSGTAGGILNVNLVHTESPEQIGISPAFAGTATGAFAAALAHAESPEQIGIAPAFVGTAAGAFAADIEFVLGAPQLVSATTNTDGTTVTLGFNKILASPHVPDAGSFDVQVAGSRRAVAGVTLNGQEVVLALASAVAFRQAVTVAYTQPSDADDRLQDLAGNHVESFAAAPVANNVPFILAPTFAGTAAGTLAAALAHTEVAEQIEIAPAFAGAMAGALAAALAHAEVAEAITIDPAFAGTAAGVLAAALAHAEVTEGIALSPAFAGAMAGTLAAALTHAEVAEQIEIAPTFAGTAVGTLVAALVHGEVAEGIVLSPAFAGAMAGTLYALVPSSRPLRPRFAGVLAGVLASSLRRVENTLAVWPSTIPSDFLVRAFEQEHVPNAARFEVDDGPAIVRPLDDDDVLLTRALLLCDDAEWARLRAFYLSTATEEFVLITSDFQLLMLRFAAPPTRRRQGATWEVALDLYQGAAA